MSELPPPPLLEAADRAAWLAEVEKALKGTPFETLVARTLDGIAIEPLHGPAEGAALGAAERRPGPWKVFERIDQPDLAAAKEAGRAATEGGADGLALVLAGAASARGFGLPRAALPELLRGLLRSNLSLRLDAGPYGEDAAAAVFEAAGDDLPALDVDLTLDPIGAGAAAEPEALAYGAAAILRRGFAGSIFCADGRRPHEAGASEAQELAAVLATAVAYLRALERAGVPLEEARRRISFLLVADTDAFLSIAKMRALRRLWLRVETACGLAPEPIRLQAETAWRMATAQDAWNDMVRGTIATFAAAVGGADGITVLPFTSALGLPDGFARRIARNTQLVLLYEAKLARVADPAAGSGGIEAPTEALERAAWRLFQEIEAEGGITSAAASGRLRDRIAETAEARHAAVADGRMPIVGVTDHPPKAPNTPPVALPRRDISPGKDLRLSRTFEEGAR